MKLRPLVGGSLLLVSAAAAAETPVDLRPQISGAYTHVFADSDRNAKDGGGAFLGATFNLSPRWAVELGASYTEFNRDNRQNPALRWRDTSLGLDAHYVFTRSGRVMPYAIVGAGAVRLEERESTNPSFRTTEPFAQAGLGFKTMLGSRVGLRGDALYRYIDLSEGNVSNFQEPVLRLGLFVPLGAAPVAEPPPPPPAPPVQPTPPPPPPPPPPAPAKPEVIFEFNEAIFFGFDSADLRPEAKALLDEAARQLLADQRLRRVEVAGHTCDLGSAAYNLGLSERRAKAVRDYLVERAGVPASLLSIRGYGITEPKVPNTSVENRQMNRRVELRVLERD